MSPTTTAFPLSSPRATEPIYEKEPSGVSSQGSVRVEYIGVLFISGIDQRKNEEDVWKVSIVDRRQSSFIHFVHREPQLSITSAISQASKTRFLSQAVDYCAAFRHKRQNSIKGFPFVDYWTFECAI